MLDEPFLKIFRSLVSDQFGDGFKRLFANIYTNLTIVELTEQFGAGNIVLIYTQEVNRREDHLEFLKKLSSLNENICVHVYRRKFSLWHLLKINFGESHIFKNVNDIANLLEQKKVKKVMLFCPHLYFSYALNKMLQKKGVITATLQHGLYKYEKQKFELYKSATDCEIAFVFHEKYNNFFDNCKKKYISGYYLCSYRKDLNHRVDGSVFYLTYFEESEILEIKKVIVKYANTEGFNYIVFHPKQSCRSKNKFMHTVGKGPLFVESKTWVGAGKIFFYNTTTYLKIKFNELESVFLISGLDACEQVFAQSDECDIVNLSSFITSAFSLEGLCCTNASSAAGRLGV